MTKRLVLVILGVTAATLATSWLGVFLLSAGVGQQRAVDDLVAEGLVLSEALAQPEDETYDQTLEVAPTLLHLDEVAVLEIDQSAAELKGKLPIGLEFADQDIQKLLDSRAIGGRRDNIMFAAIPSTNDVLVLTKTAEAQDSPLPGWLALASVVALALSTAVALGVSNRIASPVVEASKAAARIAAGETQVRVDQPPDEATDELAQLSRSINDMAATIEHSKELERQFLMSISHDLRTPLTSIKGYAEAISSGSIANIGWATSVIEREADRLDRLVQDLLDLARLDASSFSLKLGVFDLAEAARLSVERLLFKVSDAELNIRVEAEGIAMVLVDPDRLEQIIGNLIENAIRFATTTIAISVKVESGGKADEPMAILAIDDDGAGIPESQRDSVFDRHYTADDNKVRGEMGTGLGLTLVAQLVEAFGGKVAAAASPLGGARFLIHLQCHKPKN